MNDVMCFDKKEKYYLEPLLETLCSWYDKRFSVYWTTEKVRGMIPRLQKGWLALNGVEKWIKDLEKETDPMAKFLIAEIKRRCRVDEV